MKENFDFNEIKHITVLVASEIYDYLEAEAKLHNLRIEEFVSNSMYGYVCLVPKAVEWGEKIKHYSDKKETLVFQTCMKKAITFPIAALYELVIGKYASFRGMTLNE